MRLIGALMLFKIFAASVMAVVFPVPDMSKHMAQVGLSSAGFFAIAQSAKFLKCDPELAIRRKRIVLQYINV